MEDHEHIKDLESNGGHGEKVHSPADARMIAQEGQPVLRLLRSSFRLDHVLANRIRAGRIETEKPQMSMNPLGTPASKVEPIGCLDVGRRPDAWRRLFVKGSSMSARTPLALHQALRGYPLE